MTTYGPGSRWSAERATAARTCVGTVRGVVESLTRVVDALNRAGVELIGEQARSDHGGRGVRLKEPGPPRRSQPTKRRRDRDVHDSGRGQE